jgi:hypothetical protein
LFSDVVDIEELKSRTSLNEKNRIEKVSIKNPTISEILEAIPKRSSNQDKIIDKKKPLLLSSKSSLLILLDFFAKQGKYTKSKT